MHDTQWPVLPAPARWAGTRHTIHMFAQIVGKVRLTLAPPEPEWNHVALYLTSRGLTTSPIVARPGTFQCDFDFVDHVLRIASSEAATRTIDLTAHSVASFYETFAASLAAIGVEAEYSAVPSEVPSPVPFGDDESAEYDRDHVHSWWRSLLCADSVFKEHRAPFRRRHSPVNFFWGSFDLAYSRYSGRAADPPPNSGSIMKTAMDAQEVSAGFWPGDDRYPAPAFYSYAYPKPDGIEAANGGPPGAGWNAVLGEFVLPYEDVRVSASPRATLLEFLARTFEVGSQLGGW